MDDRVAIIMAGGSGMGAAAGRAAGRYGRAEEVAATIAFLASDGAASITGQNIRVDGGVTRGV